MFGSLTPEVLFDLAERHRLDPRDPAPWIKHFTGGSDDHGGFYPATTWTEAPEAATVEEFLAHLRAGAHHPGGERGSTRRLARASTPSPTATTVANSLTACFNVLLLLYTLRRKLKFLDLTGLRRDFIVLLPSAILAGIVAGVLSWFWQRHLGHSNLALKIGQVLVPAALAGMIYGLVAFWLKVPSAREMAQVLLQRLSRTRAIRTVQK